MAAESTVEQDASRSGPSYVSPVSGCPSCGNPNVPLLACESAPKRFRLKIEYYWCGYCGVVQRRVLRRDGSGVCDWSNHFPGNKYGAPKTWEGETINGR